jgi:hypothetical protein
LDSNWGQIIFRAAVFLAFLFLFYLSQRFWFLRAWQLIGRVQQAVWRRFLRAAWVAALLLLLFSIFSGLAQVRFHTFLRGWGITALVGLWVTSAFLSFLAIQVVAGIEWLWSRAWWRRRPGRNAAPGARGLRPAAQSVPHA